MNEIDQNTIFDIIEYFVNAAIIWLRLLLPDQQLGLTCDHSDHATSYVLSTEDYANNNTTPSEAYTHVPLLGLTDPRQAKTL